MQIVHDEVTDLHHVEVNLVIVAEQLIFLQLAPQHLEELVEEFAQAAEIQIILLKEFVTDGRSPQLLDKLVDGLHLVFDLARVIPRNFVRLQILAIRLGKLSSKVIKLFLAHYVF